MPANRALQELLEQYRKGELSADAAAEALEGLRLERVGDFACLDLGRNVRCGMPEVVLAEGKDPGHLAEIAIRLAGSAGRCIITRVSPDQVVAVRNRADTEGVPVEHRESGRILILGSGPVPKPGGGIVAIITAGTSDIRVAEEARVIAEEMGCVVKTAYDVGAAGIHRLFPALKPLLSAHAFVVCAGREGTLPAVVAGIVDKPVIGVPVSVGYGYMGQGQAALASMLQSCSVVAVVNIDAGFTAGAFAARIANGAVKQ
ncbi:nickel pincer cofactor biosynthesis protein LarB [uncultured Methanoregula sp.]|uniref:nickel pincer cofactor biosynthesis protein LarB n=1 Tax=uncultured Methanoregula sp. TaxID=1005933 RepID=UPI002AAAD2CE|nr:nickel pincer cofactor biosynthesis protein LarB [uncultured Methanoregula sp.]